MLKIVNKKCGTVAVAHHQKIMNTKPILKMEEPHPHVDAKARKKGKKKRYNSDFEETYETFRRAHHVKTDPVLCGDSDHTRPVAYSARLK